MTKINNEVGLYIEDVASLKFSSSFWNLIIVKNITLVKHSLKHNDDILKNLSDTLYKRKLDSQTELNRINEIMPHIVNLQLFSRRTNRLLNNLIFETPNADRRKRGLIDGLGSIIKTITGNLDANDAKRYDMLIRELQQNDGITKDILESQVQIIDEMNSKFNTTIYELKRNEESLLDRLDRYMRHGSEIIKEQFYLQIQIQLEQLFESYTIIENEIQTSILGVTFAKLNNFYTPLVDTDVLLKEFQKIPHKLIDTNLPLIPDLNNLNILLKLCSFKSYITKDQLVAILQVPLVKSDI